MELAPENMVDLRILSSNPIPTGPTLRIKKMCIIAIGKDHMGPTKREVREIIDSKMIWERTR